MPESPQRTHTIDVIPSPRLMETIGATALSPAAAVAELVANSLDARLDDLKATIQINLADNKIEIIDDGVGITLDVLRDALRLGVDMSTKTTTRRKRMGTYGLGMKTAAASLGSTWGVTTRPHSEARDGKPTVEYRAVFDLRQWSGREAQSDQWTLALHEHQPDYDGPLGKQVSGTVIWIENLRAKDHLPGAYLDHLSRAFAPFIDQGHRITVNGRKAPVAEPRLLPDSKRHFREILDEARGWVVHGWVGLDVKTNNDGLYGINLYRNSQLIEIHNKEFFKAHLMTSRILGEAHLDFVPVNFNKVDYSKGTEEWQFAKSAMTEIVRPMVEASRTMNRGRKDDTRASRALAKLDEAFGKSSEAATMHNAARTAAQTDEHEQTGLPVAHTPENDSSGLELQQLSASGQLLQLPRRQIRIAAQIDSLETDILPWDYIFDDRAGELLVVLNSEGAVFKKMRDTDFLACIAVADCIARYLIERESIDSSKARHISNRWLHEAITGQPLWGFADDTAAGIDVRS